MFVTLQKCMKSSWDPPFEIPFVLFLLVIFCITMLKQFFYLSLTVSVLNLCFVQVKHGCDFFK